MFTNVWEVFEAVTYEFFISLKIPEICILFYFYEFSFHWLAKKVIFKLISQNCKISEISLIMRQNNSEI